MVSEQLEFLEQNCNIWDRSLILKTTNLGIQTWKSKKELSPELLKLEYSIPRKTEEPEKGYWWPFDKPAIYS